MYVSMVIITIAVKKFCFSNYCTPIIQAFYSDLAYLTVAFFMVITLGR